jgi:hypothetical protein
MSTSTAPHTVNLTGMPLGWHVLTIAAFDWAGNQRWLNESIYIDGTGPDITVLDIEPIQPNTSVEVRAVVSDDFGVSTVFAYYENEDESFSRAAMTNDGQTYVVTLDSEMVRDGMVVYVRATDRSGNTAESDRISLEILIASPEPDDDEEGTGGGGTLLSGSQGLILLGLLLSAGIVILAMAMRNKRKKNASRRSHAKPRVQAVAPPPVKIPAPRKAQQARPSHPVGRPIEKPTIMIDANGVVYCKPVRVARYKVVARPTIARQGPRPTTVSIGDHVLVKASGQARSHTNSDSRSTPNHRQF